MIRDGARHLVSSILERVLGISRTDVEIQLSLKHLGSEEKIFVMLCA